MGIISRLENDIFQALAERRRVQKIGRELALHRVSVADVTPLHKKALVAKIEAAFDPLPEAEMRPLAQVLRIAWKQEPAAAPIPVPHRRSAG